MLIYDYFKFQYRLLQIIRACIFSPEYMIFSPFNLFIFRHPSIISFPITTLNVKESSDFQVLESYDNNIDRANIKIIYKLQNGQEEG